MGMQNGTATLGDSLAVSYKTKHTLTVWSTNHTPWCWLKGAEKLHYAKICTCIFIADLFMTDETCKQWRCPLVVELINCGISRQLNIIQH